MSGENPLANTMTDLMTSLMVIFILLLVNFLREEQRESDKGLSQREELLVTMEEQVIGDLRKEGLRVERDPNDPLALILIVPQNRREALFQLNAEEPGSEFKHTLAVMGPRLVDLIVSDKWHSEIDSVTVEGHTDRSAAKAAPFFNLQLSQNRSRRVMEILLEDAEERRGMPWRDRFWLMTSASGRADRDCSPQMAADDCRKVQFRIRVKSKEQRERESAAAADIVAGELPTSVSVTTVTGENEARAGI
jgi:hypothetical protein